MGHMSGRWISRRRAGFVLAVATTVFAVAASAASAANPESAGSASTVAVFEGRPLDLAAGWQDAQACLVWPEMLDVVECFSSEMQLKARIVELGGTLPRQQTTATIPATPGTGGSARSGSACSSFVRLYDGAFYTGTSLWLSTRSTWLNLSTFGFDQRTSSFKIGACSAYFADYTNGGGAWYPTGNTQAYDVAAWMASGWDNDVSSVFIS